MISLSYIAAYDPYHAIFRTCALLGDGEDEWSIDALRIMDFYTCFPWLLVDLRPARNVEGQVKAFNRVTKRYQPSTYQIAPESSVLFGRMRPAQLAALNSLAANGYIDADRFRNSVAKRTRRPLPAKVDAAVTKFISDNDDLITLLRSLGAMSLFGDGGLKERSGLQEYRYDHVRP